MQSLLAFVIRAASTALRRAVFIAAFAPGAALAQAVTAFWVAIGPNAGVASPQTQFFQAPADAITVQSSSSHVDVRVAERYPKPPVHLHVAAPEGTQLALGAYESAKQLFLPAPFPTLQFELQGGCGSTGTGRFAILQLSYDSDFRIAQLAVNFEYSCSSASAPVYGELRINSAVPFTFDKPAGSVYPDPFAFAARSAVLPSQTVVSDPTTILGINAPSPISISGGDYSVNDGPFTSQPGMVNNRDNVRVRAVASAAAAGIHSTTLTVGGRSGTFSVVTYSPGEPLTALLVRRDPIPPSVPGRVIEWRAPFVRVITQRQGPTDITFWFNFGNDSERVGFASPLQAPLAEGPYEEASWLPFRGSSPGLDLGGSGSGCAARFVVLDAAYEPGGTVKRFAANFEQWCGAGTMPTYGEVRYNSPVPLTFMEPAGESLPDPFALRAQSPVRAGAVVHSNWTAIYGVNAPVPISITGGSYSLNGGPFTSAAGIAHDKDDVVVRLTASAAAGALNQATLNAGGRVATLSVQTYKEGMRLNGVYFRDSAGGTTRILLAPPHELVASRNERNGVTLALKGAALATYSLELAAAGDAVISASTYQGATSFWSGTSATPRMHFSADGRSCTNQVAGSFTVHEVAYAADGKVERFAADFEQRCDNGPPLFGEVRLDSTVPLGALQGFTCAPGDTDRDGAPDCVEVAEGLNPDAKDNDVFGNARLFAMQQFRDFLGREGDSAGIAFWTGRVEANAVTRGQVVESFLTSPEFQGSVAPVVRLYSAYFLRPPDDTGLPFWIDFQRQGNSLATISQYFAISPEFDALYGALDDEKFVTRVYQNVLGRVPDSVGLAFWKSRLAQGMPRGDMMVAFSESPEYTAATWTDVYVTMAYMGMLRRAPDADGFDFWTGYLAAGRSGLTLIEGFLASPEYRNRFLP